MKRIATDDPDIIDVIVEDVSEDHPKQSNESLTIAALLGLYTDIDVRIRKEPGGRVLLKARQEVDLVGLASDLLTLHKKKKEGK